MRTKEAYLEAAGDGGFVQLQSIDPSRNRYRVYRLSWQPSLWGGGALVRSWGRRGTAGRSQATFYPDEEHAQDELKRVLRVRARHGYQPVAGGHLNTRKHRALRDKGSGKALQPASAWWWLYSPPPLNSQLSLL